MKTIRVGLAGCGFAGHIHSRALRLVKHSRISDMVAVDMVLAVDRDIDRAKTTARQYGWEKSSAKLQDLFESELDLIVVALPNGEHLSIVGEAAKRGIAVLLEKPIARTIGEAQELQQITQGADNIRVAYVNRFVPAVQQAKLYIESGGIGDIRLVRSVYLLNMRRPNGPADWRFDRDIAGHGASDDLGSHHTDLINFLASPITGVQADTRLWNIPDAPAASNDDAVNALLTLQNGAFGTLSASRTSPGHPLTGYVDIEGSEGALRIDRAYLNDLFVREPSGVFSQRNVRPADSFATLWAAPTVQGSHPFSWYDCFAFQMAEMIQLAASIVPERVWSATVSDGLYAMATTEAMIRSAASGRRMEVAL